MDQTNESGPTPGTSAPETQQQRPELTEVMLDAVRSTGPWLRFFSILAFIMVAIMVILGLFMLLGGLFGATFGEELGSGVTVAGLSLVYLVMGLLYIFPALFLFRAASGAVDVRRGRVTAGMERSLSNQKSFWKFLGVLTVIVLFLEVMVGVFVLVAGIIAAFG